MKIKKLALILVAMSTFATGAYAQNSGTLKKIKDSGVFTIGHRESSIPFSFYDNNQNVVGYAQDYAMAIVAAVKTQLNMPNLKVKMIPVTSQNRIPLVQNGTIDIECGSTTNNLERQQQVAFSNNYFIIGTRLLTRKDSGIKDFSDLAGKTVVTTAGTTSEVLLRKMNQEKNMGMSIISTNDHSNSFAAVQTNRAVAFMMDDVLLAGERAKARDPSDYVIVGTPQSHEAYGCMMRKGDPEFKQLVDKTIATIETSPQGEAIYKKWLQSPIPPKGLNLNFPESDDVKALLANPNDKVAN